MSRCLKQLSRMLHRESTARNLPHSRNKGTAPHCAAVGHSAGLRGATGVALGFADVARRAQNLYFAEFLPIKYDFFLSDLFVVLIKYIYISRTFKQYVSVIGNVSGSIMTFQVQHNFVKL